MSLPGKLFLIPVPISDYNALESIPKHNLDIIRDLKNFIAEDAKTARRFLKLFSYPKIEAAELVLLNEHTGKNDVGELLSPLLLGKNVGLMSDAGCPGIADPGAEVVALAHQKGIEVVPLVGPSSIVLSIMASGFNGQNFAFVGYLPVDKLQRTRRIKELEQLSGKYKQAQFFIETPYRNEQMFETLLSTLQPGTRLFVGTNINGELQQLLALPIAEWKKRPKPVLHKVPVVYGVY